MIQTGVIYIKDIVNVEGKFMEIEEFKETNNVKTNFLDYNLFIQSIPYGWKRSIIENCSAELTKVSCSQLDYVISSEKCCREVKKKMQKSVVEKLHAKWADVTNDEISEEDLSKQFKYLLNVLWKLTQVISISCH